MTRIIDSHNHFLVKENEEKNLLEGMDAADVERTVLLPLPEMGFKGACTAGNEEIYDLCKRHPDRLSFAVFADPREPDAIDTVRRYAELGAKLLKLYPVIGFYPDDDMCMPLYETLAELKMPVLSHTGPTDLRYCHDKPRVSTSSHWADPIRFDGLARKFPEITWILAHMGNIWAMNAWFVAFVNPNVYLGIEGNPEGWARILAPLWKLSAGVYPIDWNKVLWGTDNCWTPAENMVKMKKLLTELGCDESYYPAVFGQTAERILNL